MTSIINYNISKKKFKGNIDSDQISSLNGYEIKPKNSLAAKNVLEVKKLNLVNSKLIETLLVKKTYLKMEKILNMMDDNDDPSPSDLKQILGEVEKLRSIIRYEYIKNLPEKQINNLLQRTNILLQEIGIKAIEKEDEMIRNSIEENLEESKTR